MSDDCEHELQGEHLINGQAVWQCTKCPHWSLKWTPPRGLTFNPEATRKAMEETSRHLGEHRDV